MALSIAVIVGSLRQDSFNRKLALGLVRLAPAQQALFTFLEIGDFPLYNQDDDADQPPPVKRFKAQIRAADAVIFVTPEYNRSIPGVLKNAIDHASRPYGESAWRGKPAGIVGTSPGKMGTAMAQQHLRNVLTSLDMATLNQPEVFIHFPEAEFNPDGSLAGRTAELLTKWLAAFLDHTRRQLSGSD